jgi:hypothetical protein
MVSLLQHGRALIQKEPLKSNQIEFYAAELLRELSEEQILAAVKHHSLDNHWPSVNEILAFNQKASSSDKAQIDSLAQRAIALLRYPQRDGQDAAEKADPQAYALLMKAGRWYDLHVRSEDPRAMRELRYELKTLAEDALKTAKAGSKTLLNGSDKQTSLPAPETSPRAQTEPKITKEELEAKIATMMFEREATRPPSEPVKLPPDMAKYFENIENKIKERR